MQLPIPFCSLTSYDNWTDSMTFPACTETAALKINVSFSSCCWSVHPHNNSKLIGKKVTSPMSLTLQYNPTVFQVQVSNSLIYTEVPCKFVKFSDYSLCRKYISNFIQWYSWNSRDKAKPALLSYNQGLASCSRPLQQHTWLLTDTHTHTHLQFQGFNQPVHNQTSCLLLVWNVEGQFTDRRPTLILKWD